MAVMVRRDRVTVDEYERLAQARRVTQGGRTHVPDGYVVGHRPEREAPALRAGRYRRSVAPGPHDGSSRDLPTTDSRGLSCGRSPCTGRTADAAGLPRSFARGGRPPWLIERRARPPASTSVR